MDVRISADAPLEFILLEVAAGTYCVDIGAVREIRGFTAITPLPHAPEHVLGVINLRGAVMPVLDLRARLGLGRTEPSGRHVIVVVSHGGKTAGLLVDAVQETLTLAPEQLQPAPEYLGPAEARIVDAIIALEGRVLSHLSTAALLPGPDAVAA